MTTVRCDVCVIGSGAGGAVAASKLAEHGHHVVLLEEGEHHRADDMTQDELEMIPRLFQEGGQRATSDQSVMVMQGRALGGGTAHNTGLCVPVPEAVWNDWEERHAVPCPWSEFAPYLDRTIAAIAARVVDEDEINRNNRLLRRGAKALGLSHFLAHHNRLRCSGCGYCTLGCAYNRKMSVVHAFLPAGVAAGLEIRTGTTVHALAGAAGARRVEARDRTGAAITFEAKAVVVAAGAVHTPLLLERSGLARGKRVGRDLRLHPFAPVGAIFDDDVRAWRGVPQSVLIDERAHFMRGGLGGSILMVAAAQPAVGAAMTHGSGEVHRRIMQAWPRLAAAGVLVHDEARGRVRARRDGKPLISYWPTPSDVAEFRAGIRTLAELWFEVGAREVVLPFVDRPIITSRDELGVVEEARFRRHTVTLGSVHPQGTCPMGRDSRTSAVTGRGELHGESGIRVADTSIFPTSLGTPPQVTTMALAWRIADDLAESLS